MGPKTYKETNQERAVWPFIKVSAIFLIEASLYKNENNLQLLSGIINWLTMNDFVCGAPNYPV